MDVSDLLKMSETQLDDLFKASPAGPIPDGEGKGTAIIAPGTVFSQDIAECINIFAWQGKTFDAKRGVLVNRISAYGVDAIVATVYSDQSWLDQKECIVLDYSKTSHVAKRLRDEMRLIGDRLYLGRVYWDNKPLIHFSLEFLQA